MPYVIDTIDAKKYVTSPTFVTKTDFIAMDNTFTYPTAQVFSTITKVGTANTPFGSQNLFKLTSGVFINETDQDSYIVYLGTIISDSVPRIGNVVGSFNGVTVDPGVLYNNQYSYGSIVKDASSIVGFWFIDGAGVLLLQVTPNEYVVLAQMFTQNVGEYFTIDLGLEITISSSSDIILVNNP